MHLTLRDLGELAGFAVANIGPGEQGWVLSRASLTSDDESFQLYADELSRIFLTASGVPVNQVFQFLAVVHENRTADVYVNDFPVVVEMKSTRDLKKGERVLLSDIADVRRVRFPEASLTPTDKIVYLFKVGWRFGLYFDLFPGVPPTEAPTAPVAQLDVDGAERALGALYRRLAYYDVYRAVEATDHFAELVSDGWFPFIEMLSGDFAQLSRAYADKFNLEERVESVIARYSRQRIQRITSRWWGNAAFAEHRQIIEAGTDAYLQGTEAGFINCIKTLTSETEGVLRAIVRTDTGTGQTVVAKFLEHITGKARREAGEGYSLLFVQPFLDYLKQQVFQNFDVDSGQVGMSRNTSGHGVASASAYTKARALQYILILDQIYFYDSRAADESA